MVPSLAPCAYVQRREGSVPAIALPQQNQMKSVDIAQKRVPTSKSAIERNSISLEPYRSVPRPKRGWKTVDVRRYASDIPKTN